MEQLKATNFREREGERKNEKKKIKGKNHKIVVHLLTLPSLFGRWYWEYQRN